MKIPELVYEVRNLARKEEDPVRKDLFYQCAKALEILGNAAKVGDLIVAEHNAATAPAVNTDEEIKWNIDDPLHRASVTSLRAFSNFALANSVCATSYFAIPHSQKSKSISEMEF